MVPNFEEIDSSTSIKDTDPHNLDRKMNNHSTTPNNTNTCPASQKQQWAKAHSRKMSPWGDISFATSGDDKDKDIDKLDLNQASHQFEHMLRWATERYGEDTFIKAKEEFYLLAGKFFYDDECYHQRIHYFLDYFIFDRKVSDHLTKMNRDAPYFEFINSNQFALGKISEKAKAAFLDLRGSIHSIFTVKKASLTELTIIDLLTNEKIQVAPMKGQIFQGLEKGQIFQSYIYNWKGKHLLSKGVILHPYQSWNAILKACKKNRKTKEKQHLSLLMKLAKTQIESKIRKPQAIKNFYLNSLS